MHHPLNVYIGKVREYEGSRPSAIAKYQVDGELKLTELGLEGDQQAEKSFMVGRIARCATTLVNIIFTGRGNFPNKQSCLPLRHMAKTYRPKA